MNGEVEDRFLFVNRTDGFDVIFLGKDGVRGKDFFPQHVAHTETKDWASRICDALQEAETT